MKYIVVENKKEMSKMACDIFVSEINSKKNSVLGLATGSTPLGLYRELIKAYREGRVSFKDVVTFNLDEYYELKPDHEQSYRYYMNNNFFNHIDIDINNTFFPITTTDDLDKEALRYEQKIKEYGEIDLQLLGIGRNGHIGFNEPDIKFKKTTHLVELKEETIIDNSRFFSSIEEAPKKAVSMGIKTIFSAKKIILLASGEAKAKIIDAAINGEITSEVPASILQLHNDTTFILDKDAAKYLSETNHS